MKKIPSTEVTLSLNDSVTTRNTALHFYEFHALKIHANVPQPMEIMSYMSYVTNYNMMKFIIYYGMWLFM